MFRSTAKSTQRLYQQSMMQSTARRAPLTGRFPVLPCASLLPHEHYRHLLSATQSSFHVHRPPISQGASFNLLPLYNNTFPNPLLPAHRRIGIRFTSSDSRKQMPTEETADKESATVTPIEASMSSSSSSSLLKENGDPTAADKNPALKGLVDSVDTTIQGVRRKISNPADLLQYFAFVATFCLLVVGPIAVRQMQRSDTDYDELDPEDPIADLATFVRTEFKVGVEPGKGGASGLGGLDTLLADLLRSPQIQNAVDDLVYRILTSPQFKRSCSILLKELWKDLVEDPETLKQVVHLLYNAIQDEAIRDAAVQLVTEVFADKEVLEEVVDLFQRLGQEAKVQKATRDLLVQSAHNALNDPEILDHSMEFATDVVGDDVVQQTAGEALYNTLSYAVRPTLSVFLVVLGTGLIFVSLLAFQHSISPDSQSQTLDRALTNFEKSGLAQGLIKLVTFPWQALMTCKDAMEWLFLLPLRVVSAILTRLGRAGNATVETLNRCIRWILNLPIHLAQSILGATGDALMAVSDGLARQSRQLAQSLSGSFLGVCFHHIAEGISATTREFRFAWLTCNRVVARGALTVEAFWCRALQGIEQGAVRTIASWVSTKSTVVSASKSIRTGWIATNRAVANAALLFEKRLNDTGRFFKHSVKKIEARAKDVGWNKESVQEAARKTQETLLNGYYRIGRATERLGYYLDDLVRQTATTIKNLSRATRPAI